MIQNCGIDYNHEHGCGMNFDDEFRITLCPHPYLSDPKWLEKVEAFKPGEPCAQCHGEGMLRVVGAFMQGVPYPCLYCLPGQRMWKASLPQ